MKKNFVYKISTFFMALIVSLGGVLPQLAVSAQENILNLSIASEPPTIDPAIATDTTSGAIIDNVFEGLTDTTPEGEVIPALAESWDMSEDGLVYTFYLREGTLWSNGDEVVAGDFEYGWKRALNPETLSQRAEFLYVIEGAQAYNNGEGSADDVAVKALDDYTLEITLVSPTAYFTELLGMYTFLPVHQSVVESNPDWAVGLTDDYITNGPFLLTEWVHQSHFVLTKNDQYWDKENVALDEVHVQIIESQATQSNEYMSGSLDYLGSPYGEVALGMIDEFADQGILKTQPISAIYWYVINTTDPTMANVNIRKALALAVDRQNIVDNITKGGQVPALGYVPNVIPGFEEDRGYFEDADYDSAREYLAIGLEELGLSDPSELTINISINTSEAHSVIAQDIQEKWARELGINAEIDNTEWQVYLDRLDTKDFQVGRIGWTGKYNDATTYLDNYKTADAGNNDTGWESEEYKELLDQAMFELDVEARLDLLRQAEAIMIEDMPVIPLYYYSNAYVQNEKLHGMDYDGVGRINLKNVYFAE